MTRAEFLEVFRRHVALNARENGLPQDPAALSARDMGATLTAATLWTVHGGTLGSMPAEDLNMTLLATRVRVGGRWR